MAACEVAFISFLVVVAIFRRAILTWIVSSKMYKKYFAAVQYKWGTLPSNSSKARKNLVTELNDFLKQHGGDVLEIGSASGRNFSYLNLPEGSSYIALDYNPEMEYYLRQNLKKYSQNNIPLKKFIVEDAANMKSIDDNSVMAVLGVQILCSLEDEQVRNVLKEVKRVLKPGGQYFFMEHVIDKPQSLRRRMQIMSTFIGVPLFIDGCRPDKDTWRDIERAGFRKVTYTKGLADKFVSWWYPAYTFLRYITRVKIHGYAVKA